MHGAYDGPKLKSAQRVNWAVRLWDENGQIEDSESAWFDTVCGIEVKEENRFTIRPQPGGSLRWAEARYDSPYGTVCSRWERTAEGTAFSFEIPSNTEAELTLPDGTQRILSCGNYSYLLKADSRSKELWYG